MVHQGGSGKQTEDSQAEHSEESKFDSKVLWETLEHFEQGESVL